MRWRCIGGCNVSLFLWGASVARGQKGKKSWGSGETGRGTVDVVRHRSTATATLQAQERLKKHRWLVLGTPKLLFVHRRLTQTFLRRILHLLS